MAATIKAVRSIGKMVYSHILNRFSPWHRVPRRDALRCARIRSGDLCADTTATPAR
jgi:hypothetical protein